MIHWENDRGGLNVISSSRANLNDQRRRTKRRQTGPDSIKTRVDGFVLVDKFQVELQIINCLLLNDDDQLNASHVSMRDLSWCISYTDLLIHLELIGWCGLEGI